MSSATKFLTGVVAGAVGLLVILAVFFMGLESREQLKAPSFANRLSFDEKMRKLRRQPLQNVEVLFVGSSTTLHGLDSSILRGQLKVEGDLLNLGVQDLRVNQVKFLAEVFLEQYPTTKHVVMVSTLLDYKECGGAAETEFFQPDDVLDYVTNGWPEVYYQFRYLDLRGVLNRANEIQHLRNTDNHLESVHFTESGSVLIDVPREGIVDRVWFGDPIELEQACYEALRELAQDLQRRDIAFSYVIAPMRPGYLATRDPDGSLLAEHRRRLKVALDRTGAIVIDAHAALNMPDEAFFDAYHLNRDKARTLTRYVGDRMVAVLENHGPRNHEIAAPTADAKVDDGRLGPGS